MSFHKRYITNDRVISLFNDGGAIAVINWYTRGVDALITEMGLASDIVEIIDKDEGKRSDVTNHNIAKLIHDHLMVSESGNRT